MRYIRFRMVPEDGGLHPIDQALADAPGVRREAIHQIRLVSSETAVTLYELDGDPEADNGLVTDLRSHPDMVSLDVTHADEKVFAYAHFRVNETVRKMLEAESELVLETPLEYAADGALRATAIGDVAAMRDVTPPFPDDVRVEIEGIGEYEPHAGRFWSSLTRRQQETLRAAVEAGYYRSPREATYDDIATELDISGGTVGEHLQKVEETVLTEVVPSRD